METLKAELVDDGAKRDQRGRRIMSAERIEALVQEYHGSGLTQAAFARRAGLKYSTFAGWIWKRRGQVAERKGGGKSMRFAQLQLPPALPAPTELSVTFADGTVVRGADAAGIAALVRALRN